MIQSALKLLNHFYLTSFLCGTERISRDIRMTHLVLPTLLSQVSYSYLAGHYVISDQAKFRILRIDYFGQVRVGLLFCDSLRESLSKQAKFKMHRFRVVCFHLRGKERGLKVFWTDSFLISPSRTRSTRSTRYTRSGLSCSFVIRYASCYASRLLLSCCFFIM